MNTETKTNPPCCPSICCAPDAPGIGSPETVREQVRSTYGALAASAATATATDDTLALGARAQSERLGYETEALDGVPEGANLGLGCGNPLAIAALQPGMTVVDLGSGGGFDALLAAKEVGPTGRVIGVDMTPEMLALSRKNAVKAGVEGFVEFREGKIEALPIVDDSVDVVISNCVVSLSPEKDAVFAEALRVLKPGGRLQISDIVLEAPLPDDILARADVWNACVGGAMLAADYLGSIRNAGFEVVGYTKVPAGHMLEVADLVCCGAAEAQGLIEDIGLDRLHKIAETVFSYKIEARKPE